MIALRSFSGLHKSNACPTRSRLPSISFGSAEIAAWNDLRTEVAARRRSASHRWRYGKCVEMVSSSERLSSSCCQSLYQNTHVRIGKIAPHNQEQKPTYRKRSRMMTSRLYFSSATSASLRAFS